MAAAPVTREVQLATIQEAIDNRRQGGISPQIEQQTGAAGPPVPGEAPPIDPSSVLAQRAEAPTGAAPVQEAVPTTREDSPEETRIVMQLLLKKLQTLLKTGNSTGAA